MEQYSQDELLEAQAQIWSWALSHVISMSIKCAIELRIPDVIHEHGPPATSLSHLISTLQIPPPKADAFGCMMRVLSTRSTGLFSLRRPDSDVEEDEETYYTLTPASSLMLSHEHLSQTSLPLLHFHPAMRDHCSVLSTWLREDGGTPFEMANGASFWDYLARPGEMLKGLFYDCMVSDSKLVADALINHETTSLFRGVRSLVDVAGGTGTVTALVAEAFPDMKCVVLDLPHVVARLQERAHPPNLEFIGGDMFASVPTADAILLKWILHNWDDKRCVEILTRCKEAVSNDVRKKGKVIIIDMVVGDDVNIENNKDTSYELQVCFSLLMTTLYNSKERTYREWENLFKMAGFSSYKIVHKLGPRSIIEAYP